MASHLSPIVCRRLLPHPQEGSTRCRESWFQPNISRAGQSLRYLPVVERMRQPVAPRRSSFVCCWGLQTPTQGTDAPRRAESRSLAKLSLPIPFNPSRGAGESYTRIREQARIQLEARTEGQLKFELLRLEPGEGLFRLPSPSIGDIFLDFEGDPFVEEAPLLNTSSGIPSGYRKAQNRRSSAAAGLAFSMFSNDSAQVLATGSGWPVPSVPRSRRSFGAWLRYRSR